MARTVDPERHRARRLQIVDAGLTRFAADGFHGATTAAICREAGIGSGTFFHYFPTKQSLLLAILEVGTSETRAWFEGQDEQADPLRVLTGYVGHVAEDAADPRLPGFVRAVGAMLGEPEVAAALAHDEAVQVEGLVRWVRAAQAAGQVRTDLPPERLAQWVFVVLDGYLGRLAGGGLDPGADTAVLLDTVGRLLRP